MHGIKGRGVAIHGHKLCNLHRSTWLEPHNNAVFGIMTLYDHASFVILSVGTSMLG